MSFSTSLMHIVECPKCEHRWLEHFMAQSRLVDPGVLPSDDLEDDK